MSHIEKEKLIKADIASIENRVRHAFNQGYDLGYKEGKANCSEIPTGLITKNCRTCRNFGSHHGICEICKDNKCWTEQEPTTTNDIEVDYTINGLDDFIEFGKKAFGVELTIKKSDNPDTYEKLFETTKNDLGVDAIFRADARSLICKIDIKHRMLGMSRKVFKDLYNGMDELPSITPQLRKGHWILRNSFLVPYKCSECNYKSERYDNYCPNCGCRMVEPQESEG